MTCPLPHAFGQCFRSQGKKPTYEATTARKLHSPPGEKKAEALRSQRFTQPGTPPGFVWEVDLYIYIYLYLYVHIYENIDTYTYTYMYIYKCKAIRTSKYAK